MVVSMLAGTELLFTVLLRDRLISNVLLQHGQENPADNLAANHPSRERRGNGTLIDA